nr:immunoglobulin light chain junction region [Macaca mulatta]MOX07992.1 immunoglobulin light chain junction region [Macaca mulatta]MOX09559.1 immunoglobulin light chain junction region [Macaca mulatta]
CMQALDFLLTF